MDYSQLHDAQINMMVCKALGLELSSYARILRQDDATILLSDNETLVDYCNNPVDAWPIIVENLIEVSPDYDFTDESEQELRATGLWTANHVEVDGKSYYQSHQNPLRAAMAVLLMIQGANHA